MDFNELLKNFSSGNGNSPNFSSLFNNINNNNNNANDSVNGYNPLNSQNFNGLNAILPMLLNQGGGNQNELLSNLAKNNPNLSTIMNLLPTLQQMQGSKEEVKSKKKPLTYVKVKDYYDNLNA